MSKLNKLLDFLPFILLVIAVVLLLMIKQIVFPVDVIIIILFLAAFSIELYLDIIDRKYTTSIVIIIIGVIEIVAILVCCYLYYQYIDKANTELLWKRAYNLRITFLFVALMHNTKSILKGRRFEKEIEL